MAVRAKYQGVLDLGEKLKIANGDVSEENGVLKVTGTAATQYEKNLIWDAIKAAGGDSPSDINANIEVADTSVYARHTVVSGDTLGKIAKHYYGNAAKYTAVFESNTDQLDNPDMIKVGQELVIPNL
ncbi:LysM peptidoglycan-binding domain-containing protein [Olleya sp. R77988]|uniref:LysM peptidoglycan-binding domain-containing protein n=1 Tax=Olleya sp. R77988 TaxID=3093875 RepID=UPI0037C747C5